MRVLMLPIAAVGMIFFLHTDEPSESQMRAAFERSLAAEVADTMAFIGESGGREAVERVRIVGNDLFEYVISRKSIVGQWRRNPGLTVHLPRASS